jgi:hypothetical protein
LCHPWESGADDSPRWDATCPGGWSPSAWHAAKGTFVATIDRSSTGAPRTNPAFDVAGVGFNALIAWNARCLAGAVNDGSLGVLADEVAQAVDSCWDPALVTWVDAGATAETSGRVRTLDGLLPVLCSDRADAVDTVFGSLRDASAFGARFGPTGVHRAEPAFAPRTYWRGPAWPQLTYLLWVAARDRARHDDAPALAGSLSAGARTSGFAEYWDPDDGTGLGAIPQSWATLAAVVSR